MNIQQPQPLKPWFILATFAGFITVVVIKIDFILGFIAKLTVLLTPLLYALIFAFIINQLSSRIENLLSKMIPAHSKISGLKRLLALLLSVIILLAFFSLLMILIIPQLITSSTTLFNNAPNYLISIENFLNQVLNDLTIPYEVNFFQQLDWSSIVVQITKFLQQYWPAVYSQAMSFTGILLNIFMGFVLCFFFLGEKEMYLRQLKKLIMAIAPYPVGTKLIQIGTNANQTFGNFVSGQLLEGMILAVLYYIGLTILQMPFTILISTLIGIMSFIPMLGTLIAMGFGALLILAIDPMKSLWFIIFFQVVQQIEGNLIYPKVVGGKVGLSGIWVLLSIVVFGGMFGLFGVLIAVPTTAVLHSLVSEWVNLRLKQKHLQVSDASVIIEESVAS